MDEMQEILEDFLVEAFEMIEQLDRDLIELEHNPKDLELLNRIFRVAHTIKGSSSFLGFDTLTGLTHNMEDVLNKARHGEIEIKPDIMDVVLSSIDLMKSLLLTIRDSGNDEGNIDKVVEKLQYVSKNLNAPPKDQIDSNKETKDKAEDKQDKEDQELDEIDLEIQRLLAIRQEEDRRRRQVKKEKEEQLEKQKQQLNAQHTQQPTEQHNIHHPNHHSTQSTNKHQDKEINNHKETNYLDAEDDKDAHITPQVPSPPPTMKAKKDDAHIIPSVEQTVRVDVKRLDHLMNLIGELVLGKNRLLNIYNEVEERYDGEQFLEELNQVVSSVSIVTTDLQLAVMKTRMLPVGKVFNKFPRMVRDLSRELNKSIDLIISGEETELDKSIVEEIGDPLVHIIRNSCDHGIETPDIREANHKTKNGTISLKAYNEGNHIVVEVGDDGVGLDPESIKKKSIEKGLLTQREADQMTSKEALSLIFRAGFSTARLVTNVSGRGVGMDVVKTNIEKLNGMIEIDSEYGKGTTLKLKIPLTLAIIQALLVSVQEEYYAIPLSSVLETVRVNQSDIYMVEGRSVLRLRDEILSLVKLSDIFGVQNILSESNELYVVIIGLAEQKIGVIVDYLVGQEEVVIKSLGYYLKGTEGIAGATVRGDGKITLIVDVAGMMNMARKIKSSIPNLQEDKIKKDKMSASDYVILTVDDSQTDRAIIKQYLKPLGITILEASNGVDALEILKDNNKQVDAVLVDIEMPRMDGYSFAQEVRKYNKFKSLPLIAVTSRKTKQDRMRGVESGMTEYITKPYSPSYLTNVVKRNIELP